MKVQDSKTRWYSYEKLSSIMQTYVPNLEVVMPSLTMQGLKAQLNQVTENGKYFIPLNINCLTQNFEEGKNNHWAGLYLVISNDSITEITYLDPMGKAINPTLAFTISTYLETDDIGQPLLNQPIQRVDQNKHLMLVGNTDDCGPMLAYALGCYVYNLPTAKIYTKTESYLLGSSLRKAFKKELSFQEVYEQTKKSLNTLSIYREELYTPQIYKQISEALSLGTLSKYTLSDFLSQRTLKLILSALRTEVENIQSYNIDKQEQVIESLLKKGATITKLLQNTHLIAQEDLAFLFYNIAELRKLKGDLTGDLQSYTDSATSCMYAQGVIYNVTNEFDKDISDTCDYLINQTNSLLKELYVSVIVASQINDSAQSDDFDIDLISRKAYLEALRKENKSQLEEIEQLRLERNYEDYTLKISKACNNVALKMQEYLALLYKEAEEIIGPLTAYENQEFVTSYAVIGLGSMALQTITPYSDLEFAILTENDAYKQSKEAKIKNYFLNLSHLVNFKMICLGESIIPTSHYDVDLGKYVKRAVNFDLGGKTPLGRIEKDRDYELVLTGDKMLAYFEIVDGQLKYFEGDSNRKDKNIPYILEKVCHVYGDELLTTNYQLGVSKWLGENGCVMAVSRLKGEEKESNSYNGDLKEYIPDFTNSSGVFDVKQNIYRLPDRLIYNFGKIYGLQGQDQWETIDLLVDRDIINQETRINLKLALSMAIEIRSKIYHSYGFQNDNMSVFNEFVEANLDDKGILFQYFFIALPFHRILSEFCFKYSKMTDIERKTFFKDKEYRDDSNLNKAYIFNRLGKHQEVIKLLQDLTSQDSIIRDSYNEFSKINLRDYVGTHTGLNSALSTMLLGRTLFPKYQSSIENSAFICHEKIYIYELLLGCFIEQQNFINGLEIAKKGAFLTKYALQKMRFSSIILPIKEVIIKFESYLLQFQSLISYCLYMLGDKVTARNINEKIVTDFIDGKFEAKNHSDVLTSIYTNLIQHYSTDRSSQASLLKQIEELYKTATEKHCIGFNICFNNYELALANFHKSQVKRKVVDSVHELRQYLNKNAQAIKKRSEYTYLKYEMEVELAELNVAQLQHNQNKERKLVKSLEKLYPQVHDLVIKNKFLISKINIALYKNSLKDLEKSLEVFCKLNKQHSTEYKIRENISKFFETAINIKKFDYACIFLKFIFAYADLSEIEKSTLLSNLGITLQNILTQEAAEASMFLAKSYEELKDYDNAANYAGRASVIYNILAGQAFSIKAERALSIKKAIKSAEKALSIKKAIHGEESDTVIKFLSYLHDQYMKLTEDLKSQIWVKEWVDLMNFGLKRPITNFAEIPEHVDNESIRVVSYNICADFFDNKDKTPDSHHHWSIRSTYVIKLLSQVAPDIICLQELSAEQASSLTIAFRDRFESIFLSQTPSEVEPTGAICYGEEVASWTGKKLGTPLVGIFVNRNTNWKIVGEKTGRFWLNELPDEIPVSYDRGETDKGFGNMNTYRAILWCMVMNIDTGKTIYIFNSHYPLNGNSETRFRCAELERTKIKEIVGNDNWVSAGDRNLIKCDDDNPYFNPLTVYKTLVRDAHDIRDHQPDKHYGISSTWCGFTYDQHKSKIATSSMDVLDVMVSNIKPIKSFFHPGIFNSADETIIPLSNYTDSSILDSYNESRYLASDHALLGADLCFE